jgi:hypothetical protein
MPRLGTNNEELKQNQFKDFRQALLVAFPTVEDLDDMLLTELSVNRQTIVTSGGLKEMARKVLVAAESQGWTQELLLAARSANPGNPELIDFAVQVGRASRIYQQQSGAPLSTSPVSAKTLEKYVVASNGLKDPVQWREREEKLESLVCRIEIPTSTPPTYGTGFLLGSHTVLTNYHVIREVEAGLVPPAAVILRFDYKQMSDGATVNPGTVFHLADDWQIYSSPASLADFQGGTPTLEQLDFALLRVAGDPGNDQGRGWIVPPAVPPELKPHAALFILQHPRGQALKLALDTDAITEVVKVGDTPVRIRYRTNTDEGSSGSPCFDDNWNLVGLHHLGDPAFHTDDQPLYNQAIPIPAILEMLRRHGKDGEIGA